MATKLSKQEIEALMQKHPEWNLVGEDKALQTYAEFPDFNAALDFLNIVGDMANSINHHPDMFLYDYKFVQLYVTTNEVEGLSAQDFQLASMVDELFKKSIENQAAPTESQVQEIVAQQLGNQDTSTVQTQTEPQEQQPEQQTQPTTQPVTEAQATTQQTVVEPTAETKQEQETEQAIKLEAPAPKTPQNPAARAIIPPQST